MDAITTNQSQAETSLAQQFASAQGALPGGAEAKRLRETSFAKFKAAGLPTRRVEDWKYTNLRTLMRGCVAAGGASRCGCLKQAEALLKAQGLPVARRLTLVDGYFVPSLSDVSGLEKGLTIRPLAQALDDKARSWCAQWMGGRRRSDAGAQRRADDGRRRDRRCRQQRDRAAAADRSCGDGRQAHEHHDALAGSDRRASQGDAGGKLRAVTPSAYQVNDALIVEAGDGVNLQHVRLMEDADVAINISMLLVRLGRDVTFNTFSLTSGCAISRHQIAIGAMGEGCWHHDQRRQSAQGRAAWRHHAADGPCGAELHEPRSVPRRARQSRQVDFPGQDRRAPRRAEDRRENDDAALLLSDEAEADNKPELEIFADDVTCGHGATAGALDSSLLFYLRARIAGEGGAIASDSGVRRRGD